MTIGLGLLRLSPRDFWSMTPREFEFSARALFGAREEAPDRAAIDDLMNRFPDRRVERT